MRGNKEEVQIRLNFVSRPQFGHRVFVQKYEICFSWKYSADVFVVLYLNTSLDFASDTSN